MTQPQQNQADASRWTDIPFSPRRWPFFYGWVIVAAATVGIIASIPGQTVGVGVFTDKLMEALGLSRTQISAAYMIGTIANSFLLPFAGSLTDRWGTRVMIVISSVCLGASLLLLSSAGRVAAWIGPTALVVVMTSFFFLLIRFFGQGCLTMVSRVTIGKWFNHRRGLATAISTVFTAYAFNASPHYMNKLVQTLGWQHAYYALALSVGVGMAALGWVFYRDAPEPCGLTMDGNVDPKWLQKAAARVPETVKEFTRREAITTLEFWIYAAVTGWQALLITAVTFHITSIGAEAGLDRAQSFEVFPLIGMASVAVVLLGGWLSDRVRLKWLLLANILGELFAALGLLHIASGLGRVLFICGLALSGGLFGILMAVVWPRYFGRRHLGAVTGLVMSLIVFASAVGPFLFSALRDLTGSYRPVTLLAIVVPLLFILPAARAQNPQTRFRTRPEHPPA